MPMTKSEKDFRHRRRIEIIRQRKNEIAKRKSGEKYAKAKINVETHGTDTVHGAAVRQNLDRLEGTGRFKQLQAQIEKQNEKNREAVRHHAERYARSQSADGIQVERYSRNAGERKRQQAASLRENALRMALGSLVKK